MAAAIQSSIGNVVAGSAFATIQSIAASGTLATIGIAGGAGLVIIVGGFGSYKLYKKMSPKLWLFLLFVIVIWLKVFKYHVFKINYIVIEENDLIYLWFFI